MKRFVAYFLIALLAMSCNNELNLPDDDTVQDEPISNASIFNLSSSWRTEEGDTIQLAQLKGKVLVVVMIYTSCKVACPQLVADMKRLEAGVSEEAHPNVRFILVSIDPETDTPEKLKQFAVTNEMDGAQWTFLQGDQNSVREFANVLAVKYKEISPMDFSHSNIISVFNTKGELVLQQEGLGVDNHQTLEAINNTATGIKH
jgi:protein SCO1